MFGLQEDPCPMAAKRAPLFVAAIALVLAQGCYYDNEEELYPSTFCDTSNVTWSGTIQPLIQSNCAVPGCHVPGGQSPNLATYSGVQSNAAAVKGVIADGVPYRMPPSGALPPCDQLKVRAWVDGGAPQN